MASIKDYARMCNAQKSDCLDCPLYKVSDGCDYYIVNNPAEAEAIIDQWCAEHPQKTYLQDFFEKFPKAPKKDDRGVPRACRMGVYGGACQRHDCDACWNEVMLEEPNENSNA